MFRIFYFFKKHRPYDFVRIHCTPDPDLQKLHELHRTPIFLILALYVPISYKLCLIQEDRFLYLLDFYAGMCLVVHIFVSIRYAPVLLD
jgi:hypothetical protein